MNETKHTPGPWFVDMDMIDPGTDIRAKRGWNGPEVIPNQMLAQMSGKRDATRDANARLIAAAPELLEACQAFVEWLKREDEGLPKEIQRDTPEGERAWRRWSNDNMELCDRAQHQARAAIAKATGGAA